MGPVVAAAVVWDPQLDHPLVGRIRDSKRLTAKARADLRSFIEENAVAWCVRFVDAKRIDEVNILNATYEAMHGALDGLDVDVDAILVDGDRFRQYMSPRHGGFVPHACIVDGDNAYISIAAASILAKTHRDEHVVRVLHPQHPEWGWEMNKGYGSAHHMAQLNHLGPTPHHRMSFAPVSRAVNRPATGTNTAVADS